MINTQMEKKTKMVQTRVLEDKPRYNNKFLRYNLKGSNRGTINGDKIV